LRFGRRLLPAAPVRDFVAIDGANLKLGLRAGAQQLQIEFRADGQGHRRSDIKFAKARLYLGKTLRQLTDHLRG